MKRLRKLLALTVMLFVLMAAAVRGQSALDGFDPNANGNVRVVVVQPDGKILIGGDFTTLSPNGGAPVTRNRIARLNPDGTLDIAFNPNANNLVFSIAVQADGKILAGGLFTSIGGQPRNRLARLDATTGLADSFNPNANGANGFVDAIAVQGDGKILAGGFFTSIGGQPRNSMARLDATTGLADSFNPNANNAVRSIVVQANGKILAGGDFLGANSIGGQTRNFIARLDATTGMADSFDPNANGVVLSIALQADGKILVGGDFLGANSIGGQTRNYIARLDATTGLADSFNPNANDRVDAIAVPADGKILAGGAFTTMSAQMRNRIARLDATTGLADSFNPNANGSPCRFSIAVQADGKILAGGDFTTLAPNGGVAVTRNSIARLETDGRLDQTLDLSTAGSYVAATAVQPDGKILIGGNFTSVLGVARNRIARLNTDGTLDTAFNPNANVAVNSIAVQADGKILAGGDFTTIGGQARNHIARLDATTGLADSFNPNANGSSVYAIAVQADGRILTGGSFTSVGGQTRNRIARLDATTGLADSFDPNANNTVTSIAVQVDGKVLVGGGFNGANSIGGQTRNRIARLDATTGLADSFDPNASSTVWSIALQADDKILVGGQFFSIGGQTRNRIARLDATNGLADSFDPNANGAAVYAIAVQADGKILVGGAFNGANSIGGQTRNRIARLDATTGLADSFDPNADGIVSSITLQADGKILAGGFFTSIGGQPRNLFARVSNDTAALQDLGVTQTTITWTRGGSSPQFRRVTFESSTDNVNYAPLGNGAPQSGGSNWTLTGLNLPTLQNIYIRARGYYHMGQENGSESLAESVRNAFISGPSPSPTPTASPSATPTPTPTPTPPVITSPLFATGTVGLPFTYQFTANGATSLGASNLAPGLTFNTSLRAITGAPTTAGTFLAGLSATNSGGTTSATLTITVQPAPTAGPVIGSSTAVTGRVGQPFRFQVYTTGGTPAARVSASGLPPGLSIDAVTGLISGTPTAEGSSAVTLTVTDGAFTTSAILQMTFTADPALPVITSPSSAALTPGVFFSYTITAPTSVGASDPTIFTLVGTLPPGLTFDAATGTISGTYTGPLRPDLAGGTILGSIQLFATNSHGTSTFDLELRVRPNGVVNIATRTTVGAGDNVLIGGFIVDGDVPKIVIIRAIGPSLNAFLSGALQDPTLELHDSAHPDRVVFNDNWRDTQESIILGSGLQPADNSESAIVVALDPGSYTAIVHGTNATTGIAVVDVFDLGTASAIGNSGSAKVANIATRGFVNTGR